MTRQPEGSIEDSLAASAAQRYAPLRPVTALLPNVASQFVMLSDTHILDPAVSHANEFASRMRQNGRVVTALRVAAGLDDTALVHLGDLVQDYPNNPTHAALLATAVDQIRNIAPGAVFAPGNTDIGDKHDPSSPAGPVSSETLARFVGTTGAGWTAFHVGSVHGLVLAASLFNSGLPEEAEQWQWLTNELGASTARWRVLCFHYPIFWQSPKDPGAGNYDVIDEPARSRLIDMITRHDVSEVFTGHSHFAFLNRIGRARCYGVPSTSFTRPGFSELFASCAPPDQGRDDTPKLGCYLVRAHDDGLRVHLLRTGSLTDRLAEAGQSRPVVTGVPRDLPDSRFGIVLRHPLTTSADVPDAFPSIRRQPVRNDYPLLGLLEIGAREVSVPIGDLLDVVQRERLAVLRDEGVRVIARALSIDDIPQGPVVADGVELILVNGTEPPDAWVDWLATYDGPKRLSALVRTYRASAELPRWRYGFTPKEAAGVDRLLGQRHASYGDGCRLLVAHAGPPPDSRQATDNWGLQTIAGIDLVLSLTGETSLADIAEAFLVAGMAGCGFVIDGLTELDRTLDLSPGLLDRMGNPRPAFHALRVLNTLLHGRGDPRISQSRDRYTVTFPDREYLIDLRRDDATPTAAGEVIRLADGYTCEAGPGVGPWVEFCSRLSGVSLLDAI